MVSHTRLCSVFDRVVKRLTKGESKVRGGKEYYSTIGKKGAQVRHGENA